MRRIWNFTIYDNLWSGIFLDHLGFLQSTWTVNIIWRSILYLLFACKRWLPIKSGTVSNDWGSFPIWSGTVFNELIPWMITLIKVFWTPHIRAIYVLWSGNNHSVTIKVPDKSINRANYFKALFNDIFEDVMKVFWIFISIPEIFPMLWKDVVN